MNLDLTLTLAVVFVPIFLTAPLVILHWLVFEERRKNPIPNNLMDREEEKLENELDEIPTPGLVLSLRLLALVVFLAALWVLLMTPLIKINVYFKLMALLASIFIYSLGQGAAELIRRRGLCRP